MDLAKIFGKNLAVVVAHPDDEVLLCGGLIVEMVKLGAVIDVLIFCGKTTSRNLGNPQSVSDGSEIIESARVLGISPPHCLGYLDNRLDTYSQLTLNMEVEKFLSKSEYDSVITHFPGDLNVDHQLIANAVAVATRPKLNKPLPSSVFSGEVLSSTEYARTPFTPNIFVELSGDSVDAKISALKCYHSEIQPSPHPRSATGIRQQASIRGSSVCLDYCETFHLEKLVIPTYG